ncbi:dNA replication protein DnaC [Clostridium sp. CAG:557]|nr:dNA replication protein DnaC [Clostridium sp. CAG:557]
MSIKAETLHQAEAELEFLRKTQVEKNEIRKKQFYKKFKRAKDIDLQLSRTAIDSAKAILSGASAKEKLTELKNKNLALQKELETLLITANLPLDYLNIKYKCADCKDMGYVDGVMCDCLKNLIKKITYKNLNKLSPLSLSTFEAFNTDLYPDKNSADGVNVKSHMEKIFNFCKNYANTFNKNSENLFLQGATGLGKTHLSLAIANSAINSGYNVIYTSTPNILSKLEKEHFSHNFQDEETEKHLIGCDLLILDDMGTEFQTSFSSAMIYNIINSRIMFQKPTIISTNLSVKEIQSAYSKRLVSRIMGNYKRLFFLGNDIRQFLKMPNK